MLTERLLARTLAGERAAGKAVYLTPTLHNPSTATMGTARRQSIVDICRRTGALHGSSKTAFMPSPLRAYRRWQLWRGTLRCTSTDCRSCLGRDCGSGCWHSRTV